MTNQQKINKIAELQQWLRDNPDQVNRVIIESDLRKLLTLDPSPKERGDRTFERDTFDIREYQFYKDK